MRTISILLHLTQLFFCPHQASPLPLKILWPPPASSLRESSSSPGSLLKTPEVETISPTASCASDVRATGANPAERKFVSTQPARGWLTPRCQWVSWTLISTTPSPWRRSVACLCLAAVRRRLGLPGCRPPPLWLRLCTTQVSSADRRPGCDAICSAVMTDAIWDSVTALQIQLTHKEEINKGVAAFYNVFLFYLSPTEDRQLCLCVFVQLHLSKIPDIKSEQIWMKLSECDHLKYALTFGANRGLIWAESWQNRIRGLLFWQGAVW